MNGAFTHATAFHAGGGGGGGGVVSTLSLVSQFLQCTSLMPGVN